jgi:hypothetical protein
MDQRSLASTTPFVWPRIQTRVDKEEWHSPAEFIDAAANSRNMRQHAIARGGIELIEQRC